MANLKSGTLIGGNMIWNAGNMPLGYTAKKITIDGVKIYTENEKPTAADVGAVSKAGDTMTGTLITDRLTGQFQGSKALGTTDVNTLFTTNAGHWSYVYNVNRDAANLFPVFDNANSILTFNPHEGNHGHQIGMSSDGKLYQRNGKGGWGQIYTSNAKPTPADIGALPKQGLAMNNTAIGVQKGSSSIAFEIDPNSNPYISCDFNYRALAFNIADRSASFNSEIFAHVNKRVYHEGFKPTPADVGAVSKTGDTMTGALKSTVAGNAIETIGGMIRSNNNSILAMDGKTYSFVTAPQDVYLCQNTYYDGAWKKYVNSNKSGTLVITDSELVFLSSDAGSNNWHQYRHNVYHQGFKPTASELNVLNAYVASVTTQDWDTLTQAGSYRVDGATGANFPEISGLSAVYPYGNILVQNAGSVINQMYITDRSPIIYMRSKYSTNPWGDWVTTGTTASGSVYTNVDLNDYSSGGTYNMYRADDVTFTNAPADFDYGTLQVIGQGRKQHSFVTQILTWRSNSKQMIRTRNDGGMGWTAWSKIYSESQKPTTAELGAVYDSVIEATSLNFGARSCMANIAGGTPDWAFPGTGGALIQTSHGGYLNQLAFRSIESGLRLRTLNPDTSQWSQWNKVYTSFEKPTAAELDVVPESGVNNGGSTWADVINKVPRITPRGVIELGKYADFHDIDSTRDYDARFDVQSDGSIRIHSGHGFGWMDIGAKNSEFAHIYTDRPAFAFNKPILSLTGNPEFLECESIIMRNNGRKHIRFDDVAGTVDGYIFKDPGLAWQINHGSKASSTLQWSPNGELVVDGQRWAQTHNHSFAGQPGIIAPIHVAYGNVGGVSDYYPIVRGVSLSEGHGYTTQIDLGFLRQGANTWSEGVLRVASDESSSHPAANFYFNIDGTFTAPHNGNFNDVYIRSDEKLKTNVKDLQSSMSVVNKLRPVTYTKRISLEHEYNIKETGFIAQEVEKYIPDAVATDSNDMKSLKPYAIIAHLTKALQELEGRVNALEAK